MDSDADVLGAQSGNITPASGVRQLGHSVWAVYESYSTTLSTYDARVDS